MDEPRCAACGLTRDEHIARIWCPDALHGEALFQPADDPALLINVLWED